MDAPSLLIFAGALVVAAGSPGPSIAALVTLDMSWVVLAAQARRFLRSARAIRAANRTGAGMVAGAAVAIATR